MPTIGADLEGITRMIWATLFDLSLEPGDARELGRESSVTSCVHIDGEWHGALVLRCPMALAQTLTAQMFQAESTPNIDDVRDALGELANVLGGNVKALLPAPSRISLPAVAVGSDYELSVVGTSEVASVSFNCDGHPLVVALLQRSGPADAVTS
jgi:chemotaxis protein CheX